MVRPRGLDKAAIAAAEPAGSSGWQPYKKSPRKRRIIIRFLQRSGRYIVIFQLEIYFRDEKMQYSCTRTF